MTKETGNYGEELATKFLKKSGYKIIGRNVVNKLGEIDILARKKDMIVVVEVKTKSTKQFGEGFEMVNYYKRQKLLLLAKTLHIKYPKSVIRIDVISVDLSGENPKIDHFESAVEE
jgi:putative endonuclease